MDYAAHHLGSSKCTADGSCSSARWSNMTAFVCLATVSAQPWSYGSTYSVWHIIEVSYLHLYFLTLCLRHCMLKVRVEQGHTQHSLYTPVATGDFLCPCAVSDVIISASGQSWNLIITPNHFQFISLNGSRWHLNTHW